MKALAIVPGTTQLQLIERPEPAITDADQIKLKVLEVGICGTDREEVAGGRADAPHGHQHLVIGHEVFGQITEVGARVRSVKPGDYGMFTVRRGCGKCTACLHQRFDLCFTGDYTERGIKGYDGFQAEYVVDREPFFVHIPDEIASVGVLTEPLSISEKAIDEAMRIQAARLPFMDVDQWLVGKNVLVAGVGAVGLLAALSLRIRGARVLGLDIVEEDSIRPQLLRQIGGEYIDGRKVSALDIDDRYGHVEMIFEATGVAKLQFELIDALGMNGIYVLTGIPGESRLVSLEGASLVQQMVLKNQILLGSVNAGIQHYQLAVQTLVAAKRKWGTLIDQIITEKYEPHQYQDALSRPGPGEIKTVISW